ncbi:MAG: transposase [Desulfovibrio sp.]|nr:transposase [Desulfovibrio sp.]
MCALVARKNGRRRRTLTSKRGVWVVEACHSWFNRFRKLTIRYEKLDATHLALNHLTAAIIALRKVRTKIIYG